jgi:hypothetical protein
MNIFSALLRKEKITWKARSIGPTTFPSETKTSDSLYLSDGKQSKHLLDETFEKHKPTSSNLAHPHILNGRNLQDTCIDSTKVCQFGNSQRVIE